MAQTDQDKFDTVRGWLNGNKNYQRGLVLLSTMPIDKAVLESLRSYENHHLMGSTMDGIYELLKAKLNEQPAAITAPVVSASPVISTAEVIITAKQTPKSQDLKRLADLNDARTLLYKERGILHTQLCDIAYDDEGKEKKKLSAKDIERRRVLALEIINKTKQIDKHWTTQTYFEENGVWPADVRVVETELTDAQALKRLKNSVNPNISKLKKKIKDNTALLDTMDAKASGRLKTKIADWQKALDILLLEKSELESKT